LSYTIDIYRGKLTPTKNVFAFYAFVSFFPQLVAGPIERATNLLPQISKKRVFRYDDAVEGMRQILWGIFKKVVIADNCAEFVNVIFAQPDAYGGSTLLLGAVFFTLQVYGDFSGYSDIAIGTAKLFGIKLMQNFAYPFFARDFAELWRRWHISLATWFRDYLYIPLGGSRGGKWMKIRNTFAIFIISGLWHGAGWNFVLWGALSALYFLPLMLMNKNRTHLEIVAKGKLLPSMRELAQMGFTFLLFAFSLIVFRSESLDNIVIHVAGLFSKSLFSIPDYPGIKNAIPVLYLVVFMLLMEWWGREKQFAISHLGENWPWYFRWPVYALIVFLIGMYMQTEQTPFIYFQF
jgi:D-alanyl-lipoteichoic acid acyltransferase DltB (MBOAT superfamily)